MRSHSLRAMAIVLLIVMAISSTASATTVFPALTKCPLCDKSFVIMKIGSFNTFGRHARDLSSSPFTLFTKAQICPYCLYSALSSDFDEIASDEKEAMKKFLADFRLKLSAEETKAVFNAEEETRLRDPDYLGLLMARQCYELRKKVSKRDLDLAMLLFYETKYGNHEELHASYRKRAIETLQRVLNAEPFSSQEEATYNYLLGELLRQDGQIDAAVRSFTHAAARAERLLLIEPKTDRDSYRWIIEWSREQTDRAKFAKEPVERLRPLLTASEDSENEEAASRSEIALETLAARTDRDSWRVLTDFFLTDPKNLDYWTRNIQLKEAQLRIDPRLRDYIQQQYEATEKQIDQSNEEKDLERLYGRIRKLGWILAGGDYEFSGNTENAAVLQKALPEFNRDSILIEIKGNSNDTIKEAAERLAVLDPWSSEPGRLLELNPAFKEETDKVGSQPLRVVRTPPLWTERRLMSNLHLLIRAGDRQAIDFFFRWCHTVGPESLERFSFYIRNCLEALAAKTDLWTVPPELEKSDIAEQRFLACCLHYLRGDKNAAEKLLSYLEGEKENEGELAIDCFANRLDTTAKEPILRHLEADKNYKFMMEHRVYAYLTRICAAADLPRIEAIAARQPLGLRDDVEEIVVKIRIRQLLQRSLKDKP
jgi:uncharacterized protein (DUF2225 family)